MMRAGGGCVCVCVCVCVCACGVCKLVSVRTVSVLRGRLLLVRNGDPCSMAKGDDHGRPSHGGRVEVCVWAVGWQAAKSGVASKKSIRIQDAWGSNEGDTWEGSGRQPRSSNPGSNATT
ncbi:hypothetical protein B0T22DRAFT_464891 [Podospora appendiculata]|uniref:Secreted protein n=1 Tax=Podospora appendiculata TaxID=314037 RepID=A0AAE0X4S3_9PEZI|nr:hypothetical protein B0T22DRAFT_464891 [Podospora appendiculata]